MAEIEDLYPKNLSTDLSVFTLRIGLQNLSFSEDLIGLGHNSSIIGYLPEIINSLEKICPNILKK